MAAEAAAAAPPLCPCVCPFCCYRRPAWRRSVKRKLDPEAEEDGADAGSGEAKSEAAAAAAEELRERVRMQEETIQELCAELEEEQNAASTAASETMSMILRLQREKAEIAMEARQSKRFAEEQIDHLNGEILALEDVLTKRENDVEFLAHRLGSYRKLLECHGIAAGEEDENCDRDQDPISESRSVGSNSPPGESDRKESSPPRESDRKEDEEYCDQDGRIEFNPIENTAMARTTVEEEEEVEAMQRLQREKAEAEMEARHFRSFVKDLEEELARRDLAIETYRSLLRRHRIPLDDDDDDDDDDPVAIVDHGESDHEEEEGEEEDDDDDGELYPIVESPRSPRRSEKGAAEPINARELPIVVEELPTPSDGDGDGDADDGGGDDDRVYTIDMEYGAPSVRVLGEGEGASRRGERAEVKKLSVRVEALEAEGEEMRRAMVEMRTEMERLALLREIAQRLCKEIAVERMRMVTRRRRSSPERTFSIIAIFKWVFSLFCWKRKASPNRYTLGSSNYNVGLLLLLDKSPRMSQWRMLSRPREGDSRPRS